jgi:hypothetical protein
MTDHAVLVGIDTYPGFTNLRGACNDAVDVGRWLVDPAGGGLDPANVDCILSRDYPPPAQGIADVRPVLSDIDKALTPLVTHSASGGHERGRLFLYVAGHGFADANDERSAALYSAEADIGNHVISREGLGIPRSYADTMLRRQLRGVCSLRW